MTKKLTTIIKIYSKQLDMKKLELKALSQQEERMNNAINQLQQTLKTEQLVASQHPETSYMYNQFATLNIKRQNIIINDLKNIVIKIQTLRVEMLEIFATIKKYEHLLKNKNLLIAKEYDKKSQQELEEIILNRFNSSSL